MPRSAFARIIPRLRDSEGANLIEAALVLPVMILVMFALTEFALILYVQMALQNGVSQAARYAITRQVLPDKSREASILEILKRETPTLNVGADNISFSHRPLSGGSWASGTGPGNSIERITVTYDYPIMTPILAPFFSDDVITLRAEATMKNESEPGS